MIGNYKPLRKDSRKNRDKDVFTEFPPKPTYNGQSFFNSLQQENKKIERRRKNASKTHTLKPKEGLINTGLRTLEEQVPSLDRENNDPSIPPMVPQVESEDAIQQEYAFESDNKKKQNIKQKK